jgi:acyl carrier protein
MSSDQFGEEPADVAASFLQSDDGIDSLKMLDMSLED